MIEGYFHAFTGYFRRYFGLIFPLICYWCFNSENPSSELNRYFSSSSFPGKQAGYLQRVDGNLYLL